MKIRSRHGKGGHYCYCYCTLLSCNIPLPAPSPSPPLLPTILCAIYFPHDPIYCNIKYWQYLVRANYHDVDDAAAAPKIVVVRFAERRPLAWPVARSGYCSSTRHSSRMHHPAAQRPLADSSV